MGRHPHVFESRLVMEHIPGTEFLVDENRDTEIGNNFFLGCSIKMKQDIAFTTYNTVNTAIRLLSWFLNRLLTIPTTPSDGGVDIFDLR